MGARPGMQTIAVTRVQRSVHAGGAPVHDFLWWPARLVTVEARGARGALEPAGVPASPSPAFACDAARTW